MIKAVARWDREMINGAVTFTGHIYDEETNEELSREQVAEAFAACNIVGVRVKRKRILNTSLTVSSLPFLDKIEDIDDELVYLESGASVRRIDLHSLYELD